MNSRHEGKSEGFVEVMSVAKRGSSLGMATSKSETRCDLVIVLNYICSGMNFHYRVYEEVDSNSRWQPLFSFPFLVSL